MRALSLMIFGLFLVDAASAVAQPPRTAGVPETFGAKAQAENANGAAVSAPIVIHVERYTPDFDRKTVEDALKFNGYPGFVPALRKAPNVGSVELNGQKFTIRWARQTPSSTGRTIVVVTDKPIAFLGGGTNVKPRAGYEVGLIQLKVDAHGAGTGTMAAAARVKPGGETGVQVDDWAETPITLVNVTLK